MKFTYLEREPSYFENCWKFDNDEGISPCQAGLLALKTVDGAWVDEKVESFANAVRSCAVLYQMHELRLDLLSAWGGTGFNPFCFSEWLHKNAINMDSRHHWRSFAETEIGYYMVQIHVDNPDAPKLVDVSIFAYSRAYVTGNAMAARLTNACVDSESHPGYLGDLTFAKAVCADLYAHLADAPAIQDRLRRAIDRLSKMCEV